MDSPGAGMNTDGGNPSGRDVVDRQEALVAGADGPVASGRGDTNEGEPIGTAEGGEDTREGGAGLPDLPPLTSSSSAAIGRILPLVPVADDGGAMDTEEDPIASTPFSYQRVQSSLPPASSINRLFRQEFPSPSNTGAAPSASIALAAFDGVSPSIDRAVIRGSNSVPASPTAEESISARRSRVEAMMGDPNERRWLDMLMQRSRLMRAGGGSGSAEGGMPGGEASSGANGNGNNGTNGNGSASNNRTIPSTSRSNDPSSRAIRSSLDHLVGPRRISSQSQTPLLPNPYLPQSASHSRVQSQSQTQNRQAIRQERELGEASYSVPTNLDVQRRHEPLIVRGGEGAGSGPAGSTTAAGTSGSGEWRHVRESTWRHVADDQDYEEDWNGERARRRRAGKYHASDSYNLEGNENEHDPLHLQRQQGRMAKRLKPNESNLDPLGKSLRPFTGSGSRLLEKEELPKYMREARLPIQQLPKELNGEDMAPRLKLSRKDGEKEMTVVTFIGDGEGGDADAAAVRADASIQPACGVWYMEFNILSKGQDGYISVGLCRKWTNLARLVGWEPGSYGWHMDDGYVFESRGEGTHKGWPTGTTGDTVGCGVDFVKEQAFFTKNGKFVGYAFSALGKDLYPAIGLRTPGESVACNFSGPFKFDIETYTRDCQQGVEREVAEGSIHVRLPSPQAKSRWGDVEDANASCEIKPMSALDQWRGFQNDAVKKAGEEKEVEDAFFKRKGELASGRDHGDPLGLARKRKITDIDGALAGAVLQYMRHQGYLATASAFTGELRDKAINSDVAQPRTKLHAGWAAGSADSNTSSRSREEAQDRFTLRLNDLRQAYKEGRVKECWKTMSEHYKDELHRNGYIWSFRLRLQWFQKLIVAREEDIAGLVADVTEDSSTRGVEQGHISDKTLGLNNFAYFMVGLTDQDRLPTTKIDWLVAVGKEMQKCVNPPPIPMGPEVKEKMRKAFACMAYDDVSEWPEDLKEVADRSNWEEEAEMLIEDIRKSCGEKTKSYLEEAFAQTSHSLFDLGIKRGVASATFADQHLLIDYKGFVGR